MLQHADSSQPATAEAALASSVYVFAASTNTQTYVQQQQLHYKTQLSKAAKQAT
jgi:hypothetical protein